MTRKPRALFIDSIDREAGVARLLAEDGQAHHPFPAALLPRGAHEGRWIGLQVELIQPPEGADPQALRRRLAAGDDGGDIEL